MLEYLSPGLNGFYFDEVLVAPAESKRKHICTVNDDELCGKHDLCLLFIFLMIKQFEEETCLL